MAHSGLNVSNTISALKVALSGQEISLAHLDTLERNYIFLQLKPDARNEKTDLNRLFLRNNVGEMVALSSVARQISETTAAPIWHDERVPSTLVMAELDNRGVVYAVKDLIFQLRQFKNNRLQLVGWNLFGFTFIDQLSHEQYQVDWGGEFEMTLENFRDLGLAMMIAFLLVYAILVVQFKSFRIPLLVMSSILLAFGGVMPGFAIIDRLGIFFTATSMIGLIALSGIVVNNAIILLKFINQLRVRGLSLRAAIIEAGQTRLRPIILTSITTTFGSLTIVGDPVWSGLAWSIVFGLSISTILTLIVFPILYYRFSGETE